MLLPTPPTSASIPDGYRALAELAFDLQSAWNHRADALWEQLDTTMWKETGNPWLILQSVSRERISELWSNPELRELAKRLCEDRRRETSAAGWSQTTAKDLGPIAFFSMEYAVSEVLPLYSGGLGNVSGDYLKAANDLGVPLVGVGLLYGQGYFRQAVDAQGTQREFYPFQNTSQIPVVPMRDERGEWVRVSLPRPGQTVWLRAWGARVGRVPLYLLDSNDPANAPADRGITAQLYGGGPETRLLQEMALGIGGWRMLRALGVRPAVCHLNEGHAALAALERARDFMREFDKPFAVALTATRAGNVFTTHTPVEAGFDRFAPDMIHSALGAYARDELGLAAKDLLALGRARSDDDHEPFNMAWMAARGSGAINAVSRRHAQVSRGIFRPLFPRWPDSDIPIGYVTNGVHVGSWDSPAADALWTEACGPGRWAGDTSAHAAIVNCTDERLWALRAQARRELVAFARDRVARQLASAGVGEPRIEAARGVLDVDTLTIGMARRFTAYKRPTLLLRDPERLARILMNGQRPVQLVVAGKAHPQDLEGKALLHEWVSFVRRPDIRPHAVFLADYDLRLAETLVQGVDLWINTPLPPWEACGTSGMKVLVNGGINLSAVDGWWAEAYSPEVGWALPHGENDATDATRLYELLEQEVVPSFYERDAEGLPRSWLQRVRESMTRLTPTYSADRAVREYTEHYYVPAANEFARRSRDGAACAAALESWERTLRSHWSGLRFGDTRVATANGIHAFAVPVYLDDLDETTVRVELFAEDAGHGVVRLPMRRESPLIGSNGFVFSAEVADDRPASDFTPRVVPNHTAALQPLELPLVSWAK